MARRCAAPGRASRARSKSVSSVIPLTSGSTRPLSSTAPMSLPDSVVDQRDALAVGGRAQGAAQVHLQVPALRGAQAPARRDRDGGGRCPRR